METAVKHNRQSAFKTGDNVSLLLNDRRKAARYSVVRAANFVSGPADSQNVQHCLLVDESASGVLADFGIAVSLPEEAVLHIIGGASWAVRLRWTAGSKAGLEYIGKPLLTLETRQKMREIAQLAGGQGLPTCLAMLQAQNHFGLDALRGAADAAQYAYEVLIAALRSS